MNSDNSATGNNPFVVCAIQLDNLNEKDGTHFEASILGAEAVGIVLFPDVDDLLGSGNGLQGNVVVVAVVEGDEATACVLRSKSRARLP